MFKARDLGIVGTSAILATLLGGSSAFAQEVSAPVVQPVTPVPVQQAPAPQPAPVAPVESAPTAQPSSPSRVIADELVNRPIAETAAQAEEPAPRRRAAAVAPRTTARVATPATPIAADEPAVTPVVTDEPLRTEPAQDIAASVENSAAIAPVEPPVIETESGMTTEDWTLAGGVAAVLAALGLGAIAARRRRVVRSERVVTAAPVTAPERPAPLPIREDPAFQQFATVKTPERVIQRPPVMARPDVPITDPLFSREIVAPPITDPMFAPRNEVEPPITDPLFAKHDRFAGRARPTETVTPRTPELVN